MINNKTLELLSLKDVSELLKVHANTLRLWDKKGILKAVRFGVRKDRKYIKKEVLKFIKNKYN